VRWVDVNMVDDEIVEELKRGVWQDFIPMNGPGTTAIGEVARATFPRENFQFADVINRDLDETWSMSANQQGYSQSGEQSATEAKIVQTNADLRLAYERGRVLRFVQEIAEGIFALMQLFQSDERFAEIVGPDGMKQLQAWDRTKIPGDYVMEISPDAAQRVDIQQRRNDLQKLYTLARQDPYINPEMILREWVVTLGMDPSQVVVKPQKKDEPPAISYRFSGEDLMNPFVIAVLQKTGTEITPEDIKAAKKLIIDSTGGEVPPDAAPPGAPLPPTAMQQPNPPHGGTPPVQEAITRRFEDGTSAI
jgi:hypothetical protein